MSRYQPYPSYKDSGVEWLGEVPTHWQSIKFKHILFEKKKETNIDLNCGSISFGEVVFKDDEKIPEETKASYQEVLAGEFLVNPLNLNYDLKSLRTALSKIDVVVSSGYIVLKSHEDANKNYLRWLLYQFDVAHMKTLGSGVRQTINYADIGNSYFLEPTPDEQTVIANFLDRETAKIDILIAKQERMIELLGEKRSAIISHAVTKGLDPNAKMKDSGVEWLGEVPEHWHSMQIRRILPIMEQGKSPECDNRIAEFDEWGVLKTSCVNNGIYNSEANKALPSTVQPFPQYEVKEGDILMSRASGSVNLIGSVAYVHKTRAKILMSDKIFRLYLDSRVNKIFFIYLMSSSYIRANIERAISGGEGMANNITKGAINSFIFTLPPLSEQESIADYLDTKTFKIDTLITKAREAIELMKERRIALISTAVTGKIDVREME